MAKNKKKRRYNTAANRNIMSREAFIDKYCRYCGICTIATNADFCYDTMYKQAPKAFVSCAQPVLNKSLEWPSKETEQEAFIEDTFCRTGACDTMLNPFDYRSTCEYLSECRASFNLQVSDDYTQEYNDFVGGGWDCAYSKNKVADGKKYKDKQKKAAVTVVNRVITATFFTNGDDAWRKNMTQAIIDEDNNNE